LAPVFAFRVMYNRGLLGIVESEASSG
jgi:hypothetical protein